mmetsp:Transcript_38542/g.102182  ORF Transcript_38542/g.102182 Transcript_38542/m.102182 type:complete len:362 (+) Transcript_38542:172-1257(+)
MQRRQAQPGRLRAHVQRLLHAGRQGREGDEGGAESDISWLAADQASDAAGFQGHQLHAPVQGQDARRRRQGHFHAVRYPSGLRHFHAHRRPAAGRRRGATRPRHVPHPGGGDCLRGLVGGHRHRPGPEPAGGRHEEPRVPGRVRGQREECIGARQRLLPRRPLSRRRLRARGRRPRERHGRDVLEGADRERVAAAERVADEVEDAAALRCILHAGHVLAQGLEVPRVGRLPVRALAGAGDPRPGREGSHRPQDAGHVGDVWPHVAGQLQGDGGHENVEVLKDIVQRESAPDGDDVRLAPGQVHEADVLEIQLRHSLDQLPARKYPIQLLLRLLLVLVSQRVAGVGHVREVDQAEPVVAAFV